MFKRILSSIIKGFPLINSIKEAIAKPTPEIVEKENKVNFEWIIRFLIQALTIYGVIYLMNHYNITIQDVKDLFGLFNNDKKIK